MIYLTNVGIILYVGFFKGYWEIIIQISYLYNVGFVSVCIENKNFL